MVRWIGEERTMTFTIDAVYENGVLKPAQPLPLDEHAQVRVTVEQRADGPVSARESPPALVERLLTIANSVPDEVVRAWPTDGASQHDHYLYGTPKRTDLPEPK
jgi:predicted DNA-binding antitoxin AbrB/MazE fold protein